MDFRLIGTLPAFSFLFLSMVSNAQLRVQAGQTLDVWKPITNYFGYDEPNLTYTKNGRKLIGELGALSAAPVYIRTHFLLATGDGTPNFKWGSTNAYTVDRNGAPLYDWTTVDRIFDTYLAAGAKPFVEIGFMPQALSAKPDPYVPKWAPGDKFDLYYVGWSYPPRDYSQWGELVYQWVRHCVSKYGAAEVESWYWEVWNEPDIPYWHGTPEEYDRLYDVSAAAVKRALPAAKVGGPASTSPSGAKAGAFLRQFLQHCDRGGVPLDFITFHAKGRTQMVDGHVRMGLAKNVQDVSAGVAIVREFPKFQGLPIVLSESDPEGCAACSAQVYPQNAYRNGSLYAAYTAAMVKNVIQFPTVQGMLTWAFQFEDQPYFAGFRTLATNGIDKPVLNVFRMLGMLRGKTLAVEGNALAVRNERGVSVLLWNYQDDDVPGPDADVSVAITGLPATAVRMLERHYRIDEHHSNAYSAWKEMGSPQKLADGQYARLESAGQLELLESPKWISSRGEAVQFKVTLPRQSVSLIELTW
jgi:xylan 1,4-beta-xylosidase